MTVELRLAVLEKRLEPLYVGDAWEQELLSELGFEGSGPNYSHIRGNLLAGIGACVSLAKRHPAAAAEWVTRGEHALAVHDLYVALLRQHPSFKEGEFGTHGGAFPDLKPAFDPEGYVLRCANRLWTGGPKDVQTDYESCPRGMYDI